MVHSMQKGYQNGFFPNYGTSQSGAASAPQQRSGSATGAEDPKTKSTAGLPQLQQAIKILRISNAELEIFVGDELNRNPLLERPQDSASTSTLSDTDQHAPSTALANKRWAMDRCGDAPTANRLLAIRMTTG
jgi:hypothetical protein